jgi:hypothetical protein
MYLFGVAGALAVALFFMVIMAGMVQAAFSTAGSAMVTTSLLNQNPDPARSGETAELKFTVENAGGAVASDTAIELLPSYPFSKIPGEEYVKNVSTLQGFQQGTNAAIISFKVMVDKDASAGTSKIQLKQSSASSGVSVTQDFDVSITSRESAQIVIDKSKISPGNETNLKFTLNNRGSSPLKNLIFSWSEAKGVILPVFSDNTKYVKYIDVGGSVDLDYTVVADVNAAPGLYQLDLDMKFDSENGTSNEIKTKAGIFVGGETDFDVTYSESSSGQVSLSVANIGNNPAYSVTVRIPEQQGFRTTGSASSIIGNLDKGDYTIVTFQISSAGTFGNRTFGQNGQFNGQGGEASPVQTPQRNATSLKVLVDYTDTTGERHSLEKTVSIQPSSSSISPASGLSSRQSNNSLIITIVVVAVVAVGGFALYRKRKSVKKLFHKRGVSPHEAKEGRKTGA